MTRQLRHTGVTRLLLRRRWTAPQCETCNQSLQHLPTGHASGCIDHDPLYPASAVRRSRRWIGAVRFTIGALQQILLKRQHTARIAYLPAAAATDAASAVSLSDGVGLSAAVPSGPPLPLLDGLRADAGVDPLDALPQVSACCAQDTTKRWLSRTRDTASVLSEPAPLMPARSNERARVLMLPPERCALGNFFGMRVRQLPCL